MRIELSEETKTRALGSELAMCCPTSPFLVTLTGHLGAGKSHLARAFLEQLGVKGAIPSPTYTLCETYAISTIMTISHIDLYRLEDPEELEFFGFRDMLDDQGILIEWPQRAGGSMPLPDLDVHLMWHDDGRLCVLSAQTKKGQAWLSEFEAAKIE